MVILAALLFPAAAAAHVTIDPPKAPAGYGVETLRVPNEKDDASTTKLDVQLPDGFASVRPKVVEGWSFSVRTSKLATPIQTDDGPIDEQVSRITWTADEGHAIPPGAYQDFPLSLLIAQGAGTKLAFKALQTYSDGEVVRWIGAPDDDKPAALLTVADPAPELQSSGSDQIVVTRPVAAADDGTDTLTIVALVLAALALLAALGSFLRPKAAT